MRWDDKAIMDRIEKLEGRIGHKLDIVQSQLTKLEFQGKHHQEELMDQLNELDNAIAQVQAAGVAMKQELAFLEAENTQQNLQPRIDTLKNLATSLASSIPAATQAATNPSLDPVATTVEPSVSTDPAINPDVDPSDKTQDSATNDPKGIVASG